MIRPEAAAALRRWGEAGVGVVALILGAWLWFGHAGLPALFGLALAALGAVLTLAGIRHARFATGAEAPGVVEVVEGRIAYLGPVTGGAMALDLIVEVAFRRAVRGEAFWRLTDVEGKTLFIPEGARGGEALLDALAPLPGFDAGEMVRAVRRRRPGLAVVWRRSAPPALT